MATNLKNPGVQQVASSILAEAMGHLVLWDRLHEDERVNLHALGVQTVFTTLPNFLPMVGAKP